ncbi:sialidase family protein [Paenibacillus alkalitolerans]|uniref:sialidase family protein n=1 Tax=Paenibacillus alkalitolerans TaxID=2799335 RepID=UPI0018F3580B|nr:sialidase family protein [Paenibacillus alkalitolerans]
MKYVDCVKEFIFEDDRPFLSCHASTLELLPEGEVIAAWFGGTRERAGDVAIWTSRREKGGWTSPVKVADQEGVPHWNPVLFGRRDGVLFLYYKVGHNISEWTTMVMRSQDGGRTWSIPVPLVEGDMTGGRGPVKNKPIVLRDGTILAPASVEPDWDAFVDISYDGGETWIRSETVPLDHSRLIGKGIIQPALWESAPGVVHMLTRSTEGAIYRSDSTDGGRTWCPAYPTSLPNNNSGIDLAKLDNGNLVLAYNPVRPESGTKGPRTPLVIRISGDNGQTWDHEFELDRGEKQYSYPAIVADGNDIYVTYTWRRERIAFWKISVRN